MVSKTHIKDISKPIKLGLIGDNIAHSMAPDLHIRAGTLCGIGVTYVRLVPRTLGKSFVDVFDMAKTSGFRGINITYPYKEQSVKLVSVRDSRVGAINTVVFEDDGPQGHNTDYTGFMDAYQTHRGPFAPGIVCLIGTGGVGRAIAFGLISLGASVIRCVDLNRASAEALADTLRALESGTTIEICADAAIAADGADGVVNCTPAGMIGLEGTALPAEAMWGCSWAFDAVYTPIETQFLKDARTAGLATISGYELFIGQGVDAWRFFSGHGVDKAKLRKSLAGELE